MSRGMQQKVAIARALLTSPTLLLLDEPTTGLDPRSKLDVQAFIEELHETHDATIVLTTHDLAEAERLCDRITILNDATVVAEDTPEGLKTLVRDRVDGPATLEDVFMTYTGRSLDDDIEEDDADDRLKGGDNDDVQSRTARPTGPGERIERELETAALLRQVRAATGIRPPGGRPPGHPVRPAPRGRTPTRVGPVPLRTGTDSPTLEIDPMTVVTHELKASYAFIERNFYLTRRYWGWEIAFLVYSVAGALSISLIGVSQGNETLLLSLMIGAIFWNYLSVVFSWIAETDHRRALGGHARIHDDGARSGARRSCSARSLTRWSTGSSTPSSSSSCWSCSSRSSTCPARTRRPSPCSCCSGRSASSGSG